MRALQSSLLWLLCFSSFCAGSTQNYQVKTLATGLQKAVFDVHERLKILTSGHEGCPLPTNAAELTVWWSMQPPNHSDS